jgi:hypothetical protein
MNDRPMAFIIVGLGFAGFLYTLVNAAAFKAANEANDKKFGFGKGSLWFWRMLGAIGSTICGVLLLKLILSD